MKVNSPDIEENEIIPRDFTCDGEDISPELNIEDAPEDTKSFALVVEDPDAPMGTFVHWRVHDIPATKTNIKRGEVPGKQVRNDFGKEDYGGPCPPSGTHRYYFIVYALDVETLGSVDENNFDEQVKAHTIAKAELMAKYARV